MLLFFLIAQPASRYGNNLARHLNKLLASDCKAVKAISKYLRTTKNGNNEVQQSSTIRRIGKKQIKPLTL